MKNSLAGLLLMFGGVAGAQVPTGVDPSFGNNGFSVLSYSPDDHSFGDIAVGKNDSILTGGYINSSNHDVLLAKTDMNGLSANSWNGNGGMVYDLTIGADERILDLLELPDGRILATGQIQGNNDMDVLVAMFHADGSVDYSFGNNGSTSVHISGHDAGMSLDVHNGKIYIGGYSSGNNAQKDMYVIRLNMDGTLDQSFGAGGIRTIDVVANSTDSYSDLAFLSDGSIIVVGRYYTGLYHNAFVTRMDATGQVDYTFGLNGFYKYSDGTFNTTLRSVVTDANNNIYVAGHVTQANGNDAGVLIKLEADGDVDKSFANGTGVVTFNLQQNDDDDRFHNIALLKDGNILVSGYYNAGLAEGSKSLLAVFKPEGTLLNSFGTGGALLINAPTGYKSLFLSALVRQSDGKYLLGGTIIDSATSSRKVIITRLGMETSAVPAVAEETTSVAVFPNPSAGTFQLSCHAERVNLCDVSGRLQATWGSDTQVYVIPPYVANGLYYISVLFDGKIMSSKIMINR